MAIKFSTSLAGNSVLLTTEWPQMKQNLSWPYDHTILYLNWSSLPYYQGHSPNWQAQPLLFFFFKSSAKTCKTFINHRVVVVLPTFFFHFLPDGLLASLESMFSLHPFSKANDNSYFYCTTAIFLFKYHSRLCSV